MVVQIKKLTAETSMAEPMCEDDNDELIEEWSHEELVKRSQELQLLDENGHCVLPLDNRRIEDAALTEPLFSDDGNNEGFEDASAKSTSTTSDSQITVRSSPVTRKLDKLAVCRHCHKNCKQKPARSSSLKVQHSQSSSSRCCASTSSPGSEKSISSRTSTASKPVESPSKLTAASIADTSRTASTAPTATAATVCSNANALNNNILCKCKCTAADFDKVSSRTPLELRKETCKIISNVHELQSIQNGNWQHPSCFCAGDTLHQPIRESKISNLNEKGYIESTHEISNVDDWSSKLIGLSQFRRVPAAVRDDCDPFKAVPKIAVVPPTPDGQACAVRRLLWEQMSSEQSPDDSPQDELPYRALNASLRRYGTMSSLEKLPSDEMDDKTYDSSGAENNDDDGR